MVAGRAAWRGTKQCQPILPDKHCPRRRKLESGKAFPAGVIPGGLVMPAVRVRADGSFTPHDGGAGQRLILDAKTHEAQQVGYDGGRVGNGHADGDGVAADVR